MVLRRSLGVAADRNVRVLGGGGVRVAADWDGLATGDKPLDSYEWVWYQTLCVRS